MAENVPATEIAITVQTLAGDEIPIHISPNDTVLQLKERIHATNPIFATEMQRLATMDSENGAHTVLDDTRTLTSYGITDGSHLHLVVQPPPGHVVRTVGYTGRRNGAYNNPIATCVSNNRVFVLDGNRLRIQVYNAVDGSFLGSIDKSRSPWSPSAICASEDELFVSDRTMSNVQVFQASTGASLRVMDPKGTANREFTTLCAMCVSGDRLFVADNGHVQQFHANDGTFLRSIPLPDIGASDYCSINMCVSRDELFVSDMETGGIYVFMISSGTLMRTIVNSGTPGAICISSRGELFVADGSNYNIQVFQASTGKLLKTVDIGALSRNLCISVVDGEELLFVTTDDNVQVLIIGFSMEGGSRLRRKKHRKTYKRRIHAKKRRGTKRRQ